MTDLPPSYIPPFPYLRTLDMLPSWCNRNGHVDRSACLELRVPQVHRCGFRDSWEEARTFGGPVLGRALWGRFTMTEHYITCLFNRRLPRTLNGDYRKLARAMRPDPFQEGVRLSKVRKLPLHFPSDRMTAPGPDHGLPANPNHGACRCKHLGLPKNWTQTLAVERWVTHKLEAGESFSRHKGFILSKPVESKHGYLVCPGWVSDGGPHHQPNRPPATDAVPAHIYRMSPQERLKRGCSIVNPNYHPWRDKDKSCRGPVRRRVNMLLMPLALQQEIDDAAVAQQWIQRYEAMFPNTFNSGPAGEFRLKLIARYGMLFSPRRFLCSACLAVRRGVVKASDIAECRRGYFKNRPVATRPQVRVPKPTVIPRSVRRIDRLAKKARRAIKVADIWMARLAALEAETNPARALDLIMRYYVNPINKRAHPLKNVRWCKSLEPYRKKKGTTEKP